MRSYCAMTGNTICCDRARAAVCTHRLHGYIYHMMVACEVCFGVCDWGGGGGALTPFAAPATHLVLCPSTPALQPPYPANCTTSCSLLGCLVARLTMSVKRCAIGPAICNCCLPCMHATRQPRMPCPATWPAYTAPPPSFWFPYKHECERLHV
jgi:hypothetical protein